MEKKKLLVVSFIIASMAAFLVFLFAKQMNDDKVAVIGKQVEVVKAAREIPVGTPLTQDMVKSELVPEKFLPPNPVFKTDVSIYYGQPVTVKIAKDAMVLASDFTTAEVSKDLSGQIPEGERALSIPVTAISGVSGLLSPGDRVDVLGTFPVTDRDQVVGGRDGVDSTGYVTMPLLQNVTLLAVGQQYSKVEQAGAEREQYSAVTMSVTIEEAELLTISQTRGKLMLLLRNRDDIKVASVTKRSLKQVLMDLEIMQENRVVRVKRQVRRKVVKKDRRVEIVTGAK